LILFHCISKIAEFLLQNGAEVDAADKYGSTALHRSSSLGYIKIVGLLIEQFKANVNCIDCEGNTPL
jgi:ankyrin repeat protein